MRVPLVVVTGFLGAGKTTLVNQLLADRATRAASSQKGSEAGSARPAGTLGSEAGSARLAGTLGSGAGSAQPAGTLGSEAGSARPAGTLGIIVNELGEIGIDGALLGSDATRQVELPGGCVCCVLGPELDQTLLELIERNPDLEAIVLETTGVAEPLPIAWAVRRDPVQQQVRLAAVVTLVDAANFRASRKVSVSVDAQVAYADVLLITKEAIAGADETREALAAAHELAPRALVLRGSTAEHAAWLEQMLADPVLESAEVGDHHGHDHAGGICRDADRHAHGIDSMWVDLERPVDVEELEDQLAELPPNYVRIKGIVRGLDGDWVAIHRVGVRVSTEPFARKPDELLGAFGRIVALGSELAPEKLAHCLDAAYLT